MAPRKRKQVVPKVSDGDTEQIEDEEQINDEDYELQSLMPRRIRDCENIINISATNRNLTTDQICLLFLEIAKRPDQNQEFEIGFWLEKYLSYHSEPNYSEVALILINAAQIFGRKVDFLHDFILQINTNTGKAINLCEQTKVEAAAIEKAIENGEPVVKKARANKKKKEKGAQPTKDKFKPFELFGGNITPMPITPNKDSLKEVVLLEHKEKRNDNLIYSNLCERLKRKLMILKILKQARRRLRSKRPIFSCEFPVPSDNHDILNYANEELTDLDDETIAGTRRDFFVFMGMISMHTQTLNLVHNFTKEKDEYDKGFIGGATLLPPEYVETVYNVKVRNPTYYYEELRKELDIWNNLGPTRQEERERRCVLIAYQKAAKILDEQNLLNYLKASNIISEQQSTDVLNKLLTENDDNINMSIVNPAANSTMLDNSQCFSDSGVGTSIISSQNTTGTMDDTLSFEMSQSLRFDTQINQSQVDTTTADNLKTTVGSEKVNSNLQHKFNSNEIIEKLISSKLRISVDEGISIPGSGRNSPLPKLSDLDEVTLSLLSPTVELVDICDPLTDIAKRSLTVQVSEPMDRLFFMENAALHKQCFNLQLEIVNAHVPLILNILQLPEKCLRRKNIFALTEDFKMLKLKKKNLIEEAERLRYPSPFQNDEDFLGFEDSEINPHSGINNQLPEPNLLSPANPKNIRSFSQDSGIEFCNSPPHTADDIFGDLNDNSLVNREAINNFNSGITNNNLNNNRSSPKTKKRDDGDNLVDRITEWYSHLAPILKASKERSYFDIHAYGKEIITSFPCTNDNESPTISFEDLMSTKQQDCTARYFLSMLQMANNGNIEIVKPSNHRSNKLIDKNELKLKLLNKNLQSEGMDEAQSFDNYEPAAKQRKIVAKKVENPIHKIFKKCEDIKNRGTINHNPFKKDNKIEKMIEKYKHSPAFGRDCKNFTVDQVISIVSKLNTSQTSESNNSDTSLVISSFSAEKTAER